MPWLLYTTLGAVFGYLLSRAGAQCSTAVDGKMAVAAVHASMASNKPFHVVLMDFHMPEMDGLQAME